MTKYKWVMFKLGNKDNSSLSRISFHSIVNQWQRREFSTRQRTKCALSSLCLHSNKKYFRLFFSSFPLFNPSNNTSSTFCLYSYDVFKLNNEMLLLCKNLHTKFWREISFVLIHQTYMRWLWWNLEFFVI